MEDEYRWIVSVKAVMIHDGRVLLLKNDRRDWELPGGRVDEDDPSIEAALAREIDEETGIPSTVGVVRHCEIFSQVGDGRQVMIIAYDATVTSTDVTISHEHVGADWIALDELDEIDLPGVYRSAIAAVSNRSSRSA